MKQLSQRLLGPATIITMALTIWLGIWITPRDKVQGNLARLLYVHPAIATVALYLSFGTATIASALYLWRRTRSLAMDRVAHCAMEVSLVFIILTLITGSIWGRPAWGCGGRGTRDSRRRRSSASSHSGTWHFVGPTTTSNCARVAVRSSRSSRDQRADRPLLGAVVAHAAPGRDVARTEP